MASERKASPATTDGEAPRPRVQSAARAIGILLAIAQSEDGLTTKEISERVQIGRQATYHLLHTLTSTGMVTRNDRNRYLLGFRVGTLAEGFARQIAPSEHLAPIVRALARETGETAYASGWLSGEIMAFIAARGTSAVQAGEVPQGYVGNAHARASGKLLLAYAPAAVRDAYLQGHKLQRLTDNTITSRRALEAEFEAIRERGYATDDEEFAQGLYCIAYPFDAGYSPFVLSLAGPRERVIENLDEYVNAMQRVAASGAGTDALAVGAASR
jgi:IclR family transcriptional regulator, acetate operon repressor